MSTETPLNARQWYTVEPGEWLAVEPGREYQVACCDCRLVHRLEFRLVDGRINYRVRRDDEATAQKRQADYRMLAESLIARLAAYPKGIEPELHCDFVIEAERFLAEHSTEMGRAVLAEAEIVRFMDTMRDVTYRLMKRGIWNGKAD